MRKNKELGFTIVEVALVVALVGLVAFIGWRAWDMSQQSVAPSNLNTQAEQSSDEVADASKSPDYKRETTVPDDWVKYEAPEEYGFSLYHPPGWSVVADSKANPDLYVYEFGLANRPDAQTLSLLVGVSDRTLDEETSRYKEASRYEDGVGDKLLSEKTLSFDGHELVELHYQSFIGLPEDPQPRDKYRQFFVHADNRTYVLSRVYESDQSGGGLTAEDSLILFESFNFQ